MTNVKKIVLNIFMLSFAFSSYAADVAPLIEIKSIAELPSFMREKNLDSLKTLVISDVDETAILSAWVHKDSDRKLVLAPNKERLRIFYKTTTKVLKELGLTPSNPDYVDSNYTYFREKLEPLEDCTKEAFSELARNKAKIIMCSGMPSSREKEELLRSLFQDDYPFNYLYIQGNKTQALDMLKNYPALYGINLDEIDNIIFVDNNKRNGESSVTKFLEAAKNNPNAQGKKVFGMYLSYFRGKMSYEKLLAEYAFIKELTQPSLSVEQEIPLNASR